MVCIMHILMVWRYPVWDEWVRVVSTSLVLRRWLGRLTVLLTERTYGLTRPNPPSHQ